MLGLRFRSVATRQLWLAILSVVILCTCVAVGMGIARGLTAHSGKALVAKDVIADVLPPPVYLIEMRLVLSQSLEGTMSAEAAAAQLDQLSKAYFARMQHWQKSPPFGLEKLLLGKQHDDAQRFMQAAREMVAHVARDDMAAARALLPQAHRAYRDHRAEVDKTVAEGTKMAAQAIEDFDQMAARSQLILMVVLCVGVAAMMGLSWLLSQTLVKSLKQARDLAQAVAAGDLRQRAQVRDTDELAQLMQSLNGMCDSLSDIVGKVRRSGMSLAEASEQMASNSQELRERADKHQAELKSTSQALKAVTGFVSQNAEAAENASRLAKETGSSATRGVSAIDQVGQTMRGITQSSNRVADMVGMIQGIAFQTNLLALNAAVEAARAGDQGKGFAVVAAEVRQLATRSNAAAKEIKTMVDASRSDVLAGGPLTEGARTSIHQMVGQVTSMSNLVQGIWETTFAQSSGINMLDESMEVLAQDAEGHLMMVSQTADVALGLQEHAGALTLAVRAFQLPDTVGSGADGRSATTVPA
ncbi:MAG: methyl-accepting chemotaxis protein [Rubrivivax sp.]|jgi:methyl-accepting chemotaxis protein|nr:methyl-accepting chemotaxis protein [Rubrivivax sp.]